MTFSIIVPTYNQQQYLSDTLDSIIDQTVKPKEIIVVNDGSTDNTKDIVARYPTVTLINQVNKGLPSARNTGIMNATGDYILPLDSDDILLETCIERMTAAAEGGWDIIIPSFKAFGVANNEIVYTALPTLEEFKSANRLPYFCAIKRSVLLSVGGYNPKMIYGWEDYDLWFDLLKRGATMCALTETLVLYRVKENSMITHSNMHKEELWTQIVKNHPEIFK